MSPQEGVPNPGPFPGRASPCILSVWQHQHNSSRANHHGALPSQQVHHGLISHSEHQEPYTWDSPHFVEKESEPQRAKCLARGPILSMQRKYNWKPTGWIYHEMGSSGHCVAHGRAQDPGFHVHGYSGALYWSCQLWWCLIDRRTSLSFMSPRFSTAPDTRRERSKYVLNQNI